MRIELGAARFPYSRLKCGYIEFPRVLIVLGLLWETGNYGVQVWWDVLDLPSFLMKMEGASIFRRSWHWTYATREFARDHGRWWWLLALVPLTIHRIENHSASRAWTGRSSEFVLWWHARDYWRRRTRMAIV